MKRIYMVLFAAAVMAAGTGCEIDYDLRRVDDILVNALNEKFPEAIRVEWERNGSYYVAEFHEYGSDVKVWFKKGGEWCMTERDMGRNYSDVPAAVKEAMENSKYSMWEIDDIDKYEKPGEVFYVFTIETSGARDRVLFFSENGTLLKDAVERGDITPKTKF